MFDPSVFWPMFARCGLLKDARYTPPGGTERPVKVGFVQPDMLMLQNAVQSSQKEIEYQTADLPELSEGDRLEIDGEVFRVAVYPAKQGDGYFSRASINKVR